MGQVKSEETHKINKRPVTMNLPEKCPLCAGAITVTRFHCDQCGSTVEGRFEPRPSRFDMLSPEQMQFVEVFVRCEGRLNRMETELDLSYPTLRARLTEIIRKMGYEPGREDAEPRRKPLSEDERRKILDQLEQGTISPDQAMKQLNRDE
jgi:hypothetical protein